MGDKRYILQEGILVVITLICWIYSVGQHNKYGPNQHEEIKIPRLVGIIFGGFANNGILNYRALILQLGMCVFFVVLSLFIFNRIAPKQAFLYINWSFLLLAIIAIFLSMVKN